MHMGKCFFVENGEMCKNKNSKFQRSFHAKPKCTKTYTRRALFLREMFQMSFRIPITQYICIKAS